MTRLLQKLQEISRRLANKKIAAIHKREAVMRAENRAYYEKLARDRHARRWNEVRQAPGNNDL